MLSPDQAEIARIVEDAVGSVVDGIEPAAPGNSRTYLVSAAGGGRLVVRTHVDASTFASTVNNLSILGTLGLPVSRVLACDLDCTTYPFAYMVLESIPGCDLRHALAGMTRTQMSTLAGQLVGYQNTVATLPPGVGYGYAGIGEKPKFDTWTDAITFEQARSPVHRWTARIDGLTLRHARYLDAVEPLCFLDDITVKNVMIDNGELQGLIDFDCVCYGDPLWWIGLTAAGVVSDVGVGELFYVDELCRLYGLTDDQRKIVPLYNAMHAAGFIARSNGGDYDAAWLERMTSHIDRWLDEAE